MVKKNSKQIILGIDPGTRITGYGLLAVEARSYDILDYGCIRPPQKLTPEMRYRVIFEGVEAIVKQHRPTALAIETQYVKRNVPTAIKLGMARGVATLAATLHDVPVFEYAPSQAKLAVVGTGRASKEQVQKMLQTILALDAPPTPEDAADALALALCHAHRGC